METQTSHALIEVANQVVQYWKAIVGLGFLTTVTIALNIWFRHADNQKKRKEAAEIVLGELDVMQGDFFEEFHSKLEGLVKLINRNPNRVISSYPDVLKINNFALKLEKHIDKNRRAFGRAGLKICDPLGAIITEAKNAASNFPKPSSAEHAIYLPQHHDLLREMLCTAKRLKDQAKVLFEKEYIKL